MELFILLAIRLDVPYSKRVAENAMRVSFLAGVYHCLAGDSQYVHELAHATGLGEA